MSTLSLTSAAVGRLSERVGALNEAQRAWRTAALERYKMGHSYYGALQGSFEGQGFEFFKRVWHLWLLAPFAIVVFPFFPLLYAKFKAAEWR